jgi:chemotaxis protein methyltransferase CheR
MQLQLKEDEFNLLRLYVEQECGISVTDEKRYLFETRLNDLVKKYNCKSFGEFYLKAKNNQDALLKSQIIDAITTNETLWFRDESPFLTLKEQILPNFINEIKEGKRNQIKIWSAASSTGQEPYSIAITLRETPGFDMLNGRLTILASDISDAALKTAREGRYDSVAMSRGLTPQQREKYFKEEPNRTYVLKDEIRNMVRFQPFNLQQPFDSLGKFDVIFLRNVAIYFSHDFKVKLFKKLYQSLNPGGFLFLGSSEHLQAYNQDFQPQQHGRCIYYQRKA